jgi:uncharacterized protein YjiS (DUF1127 family)
MHRQGASYLQGQRPEGEIILLNSRTADAGWSARPTGQERTIAQRMGGLWRRLGAMRAVARQRHDLLGLDDRTLMDIGVSRADVEREASRGFWDIDPQGE